MDPSFSKRLRQRFQRDPFFWVLWSLAGQLASAGRQRILARALHAPGLKVGKGSVFRGIRHIRFAPGFSAHGAVWIEAVSDYAGRNYTPAIQIGRNVRVSNDLHISSIERITIGDGVLFGSRVYVSDHNHGDYRSATQTPPTEPPALRCLGGGGPVTIENNVWIGHNVCIIGPAHIGFGAIVGANSVVRGCIPPQTIVAGTPAVELKRYDPKRGIWERSDFDQNPLRIPANADGLGQQFDSIRDLPSDTLRRP